MATTPVTTEASVKKLMLGDKAISPNRKILADDAVGQVIDANWIRGTFLISNQQFEDSDDVRGRFYTTAQSKFTNTQMGGNIGVNPRPGFTPYADLPVKGRIKNRPDLTIGYNNADYGMGRYYSEAIDDNAKRIYLRFGVPQYTSLSHFISNAYNPALGTLTRTGRGPSTWYQVGKVVGTLLTVTAWPALSAGLLAGKLVSAFFSRSTSSFYSIKPTMHLYWLTVDYLVNSIAINSGIMPRFLDEAVHDQKKGNPYKLDQNHLDMLSTMLPDVFTSQYGIDIFAAANKAQRLANQAMAEEYSRLNSGSGDDYLNYVKKDYADHLQEKGKVQSFIEYIQEHLKFGYYTTDGNDPLIEADPKTDPTTGEQTVEDKSNSFGNFFDAEFRSGSQFAVFIVDNPESVSESFGNSAVEAEISTTLNGMSSRARETKFSFAGGNVGDGLVSNIMEAAVKGTADVIAGLASGVTLGFFDGLRALAGNGYIDIPKHWQSSSVEFPTASYTMKLVAPYNNVISRIQNLFIPIAMLVAGTAARSTGAQSYDSPYYCQLYDQGRCQIQRGIISSLTITRGTGNLAFTNKGVCNAVNVSFTVMDLSNAMHVPVSTGSLFDMNKDGLMDEDNPLTDYLAVLAGQDIYSQLYTIPKAKLAFAKRFRNLERMTSPAYWASVIHDKMVSGPFSVITLGAGKALEAIQVGSAIIR